MIFDLLYGKNERSQKRLDALSKTIGKDPNISWYPSAGNDYRDTIRLSEKMAEQHGITELPDLFIHTDYFRNWLRLEVGVVYSDEYTTIRIEDKFEIGITTDYNYHINPRYVHFASEAPRVPTIYLLDIVTNTTTLGEIRQPVLFFVFENINFLDEFVLRYNIRISHIVKVREGCGFGGNGKSIALAYAFLSVLRTKYLMIDTEEHTDYILIEELKTKHNIAPLAYDIELRDSIASWSGFNVKVYSVSYIQQEMNKEKMVENFKEIETVRR